MVVKRRCLFSSGLVGAIRTTARVGVDALSCWPLSNCPHREITHQREAEESGPSSIRILVEDSSWLSARSSGDAGESSDKLARLTNGAGDHP
jgi:hypothetical protein